MNNNTENNNNANSVSGYGEVRIAPPSSEPIDAHSLNKQIIANKASTVTNTTVTNTSLNTAVNIQKAMALKQNQTIPVNVPPPPVINTPSSVPHKRGHGAAIFIVLLLFILLGLVYYIYIETQKINYLTNKECSPVSISGNKTNLDINSTLVQDLYQKVKTNIKEDLADFTLDDNLKLYLAYRQIPVSLFYSSNCNLFSSTSMNPYTCDEASFTPKAFSNDTLEREAKILFGDNYAYTPQNIQLSRNNCIGGYQYIADRNEYVEGLCSEVSTTPLTVTKTLKKATSQNSIIKLYEYADYSMAEGVSVPSNLKDGTYIYTFQLDKNYRYIYVSKEYQQLGGSN